MTHDRCKLIVIDGLDGSGKATQCARLCETLAGMGYRVGSLTFPDYDSPASEPVKMYLNGQLGSSPDDVNAYAASAFFAVDRVVSYINSWSARMRELDFMIADRYTTSNIIHQMAKVAPDEREAFIDWLEDFEYRRLGLPAPDLVIFLDVDPAISQRLMLTRYDGDEDKKDIHEKNRAYLSRCRESAHYVIAHQGWTVVPCDDGENIRPIPEIAASVLRIIKERFDA